MGKTVVVPFGSIEYLLCRMRIVNRARCGVPEGGCSNRMQGLVCPVLYEFTLDGSLQRSVHVAFGSWLG